MPSWNCVLELDNEQSVVSGSTEKLCQAICNAADLRIHTDFRHNEHIDTESDNPELVNEISEFHETCLLDQRWVAGFMTTRQPISLPDGFGPQPSMSFFMYNQDGKQAMARLRLDGQMPTGPLGPSPCTQDPNVLKYHKHDIWDADTNALSTNFTYDFEVIRYFVRDDWQQVLSHDANGTVISGSIDDLAEAFLDGCEVKIAVSKLFADLADPSHDSLEHEVFIQTGWCYYYTEQKLFIAATHPLIRVRPAIPLAYISQGWDFGWLMVRTDGLAKKRMCNPYNLGFADTSQQVSIRWFIK